MEIKNRHFLSNKDKRELIEKLSSVFDKSAESFFSKSDNIEIGLTEKDEDIFYFKDGRIWLFPYVNLILPSIRCVRKAEHSIPKVTVDIGAINFVVNGADIMAPGVVYFNKEIKKGDIVIITEEKADTVIAVGKALVSYETFTEKNKGKVVENVHHLKDYIWEFEL